MYFYFQTFFAKRTASYTVEVPGPEVVGQTQGVIPVGVAKEAQVKEDYSTWGGVKDGGLADGGSHLRRFFERIEEEREFQSAPAELLVGNGIEEFLVPSVPELLSTNVAQEEVK